MIHSCLFNPFNNNKIYFLFCNNTSKPPVLFMFSHYFSLIIFFQKMLKTKQLGNKLPSRSTNNLKPTKPCGQSSIKAFHRGLPRKKGKLNKITSTVTNKYAFLRSFGSSSIVGCSEKFNIITKSFCVLF